MSTRVARPLFDAPIVRRALWESLLKLNPRHQLRNPVMFTVYLGSAFTTLLFFQALARAGGESPWFILAISCWLWFTVLFANFAEAMAEGRGKAQADTLRKSRCDVSARRLAVNKLYEMVSSKDLGVGDIVVVKAGELIPLDGEVIEGVASVDESAITGESAPVIREGGGRSQCSHGGNSSPVRFPDHSLHGQTR